MCRGPSTSIPKYLRSLFGKIRARSPTFNRAASWVCHCDKTESRKVVADASTLRLTMRLSDARLRHCETKLIYPNHRPLSLAQRRRDPRSLEPIVRPTCRTEGIHSQFATLAWLSRTSYRDGNHDEMPAHTELALPQGNPNPAH